MERRYDLHHYEIIMLPTRQYFDRQVIMHMNWILGIVGKCWSFSECPKCTTFLFRKYWRDWLQELNGSGMKWLGSNRHYNDFTHYAGTRNRKLSFVKNIKTYLWSRPITITTWHFCLITSLPFFLVIFKVFFLSSGSLDGNPVVGKADVVRGDGGERRVPGKV